MDTSVHHPVVRSGAAVGQDSDTHEEDEVSSQVRGRSLVSPNANDSQVMNTVRSDAWWICDCWRDALPSSLPSDMRFAVANEISIHLACMVDPQMSNVNQCADPRCIQRSRCLC